MKEKRTGAVDRFQMKAASRLLSSPSLFGKALRFANPGSKMMSKHGRIVRGPGLIQGWVSVRDLKQPVKQEDSFRTWMKDRKGGSSK
ncbi:Lactate utilization protein B [compost metagenome]